MVTKEMIRSLILESEVLSQTRLGRITVVTVILPSGFTITETSASVSVENYDYSYGIQNCLSKIENRLWELEAYRLMANAKEAQVSQESVQNENVEQMEGEVVYEN